MEKTTTTRLGIEVLGGLRVRTAQGWLGPRDLGGGKPRQLLEVLVLAGGAPVSKHRLVDLLWGDEPTPDVVATLETYVSVLRKRLQPGVPARGSVVRTVTGGYALDLEQADVDLLRFAELSRLGRATPDAEGLAALAAAVELGDAEVLPGAHDAWVEQARSSHRRALVATLVAASRAAARSGEPDRAVGYARRSVAEDPLNEEAWAALLAALGAAGRPADGLRAYDQCRRTLADELGCAPGPALRALQSRLLDQAVEEDGELADAVSAVLRLHAAALSRVPAQRSAVGAGSDLLAARSVIDRLLRATA